GPASVSEKSLEPEVAETLPADLIGAIDKGLDDKRFNDVVKYIDALKDKTEARTIAVLVRATAKGNDQIAGQAMSALKATPALAKSFKTAWAPLPKERRQALIKMASEFYGEPFAASIR